VVTVEGRAATGPTIIVRVWYEPHDDIPRARLVSLPDEVEVTAAGFDAIEQAFAAALRSPHRATGP
jgi:hypothetical protein